MYVHVVNRECWPSKNKCDQIVLSLHEPDIVCNNLDRTSEIAILPRFSILYKNLTMLLDSYLHDLTCILTLCKKRSTNMI